MSKQTTGGPDPLRRRGRIATNIAKGAVSSGRRLSPSFIGSASWKRLKSDMIADPARPLERTTRPRASIAVARRASAAVEVRTR